MLAQKTKISLKIATKPKTNQKSSKNTQFICVRYLAVNPMADGWMPRVCFSPRSVSVCVHRRLLVIGEKQNRSLIPMKNLQLWKHFDWHSVYCRRRCTGTESAGTIEWFGMAKTASNGEHEHVLLETSHSFVNLSFRFSSRHTAMLAAIDGSDFSKTCRFCSFRFNADALHCAKHTIFQMQMQINSGWRVCMCLRGHLQFASVYRQPLLPLSIDLFVFESVDGSGEQVFSQGES